MSLYAGWHENRTLPLHPAAFAFHLSRQRILFRCSKENFMPQVTTGLWERWTTWPLICVKSFSYKTNYSTISVGVHWYYICLDTDVISACTCCILLFGSLVFSMEIRKDVWKPLKTVIHSQTPSNIKAMPSHLTQSTIWHYSMSLWDYDILCLSESSHAKVLCLDVRVYLVPAHREYHLRLP